MIKTCELQTCDEKYTVEIKDLLKFDGNSVYKVDGYKLFDIPLNLSNLSDKLDNLYKLFENFDKENVYADISNELNSIRELINNIQNNLNDLINKYNNLKSNFEILNSNYTNIKDFNNFKANTTNQLNNLNSEINVIDSKINDLTNKLNDIEKKLLTTLNNSNSEINNNINLIINDINKVKVNLSNFSKELSDLKNNFDNLYKNVNNKLNDFDEKINTFSNKIDKLMGNDELETGGLTFKNKNGKTTIRFNSSINYGSDYGYITYYDDYNDYAFWGDSKENSTLIVGVENDGRNRVSDVVALKAPAAIVLDSSEIIIKNGNYHFSLYERIGITKPDYNSGWVTVNSNGLILDNPLGQNAVFIGFAKFNNGDIMQFGVFSYYQDDDNLDPSYGFATGTYLIIQPSKLIIAVAKHSNNGYPKAIGLGDGISFSEPEQDTFYAKIIGWKLANGVI